MDFTLPWFNGPYAGKTGQAIYFSSPGSTGSITSYNWSFGDGGTSTVANPSYTYKAFGTYTATLMFSTFSN